jgi:cell division control protein 6
MLIGPFKSVGIANALDLTDRILPRLEAKGCRPQLLDFKPYNQHQLAAIINSRLAEVCIIPFNPSSLLIPSPALTLSPSHQLQQPY